MLDPVALQTRDSDLLPTVATSRAVRVLVVDDNHDAADALAAALGNDYLAVNVAYSGASALEQAARTVPDVMLLDIGMPGMDGYELVRRVRESEWGINLLRLPSPVGAKRPTNSALLKLDLICISPSPPTRKCWPARY
nr:response regulator [Caballeronia sp. GAWG1-1]